MPDPSAPRIDPGAQRGTTTIAPEVVAKIAAIAAHEIDQVDTVRRSGLARFFGRGDRAVNAEVERETAVVDLALAIRWPAPIASTADRVRRHVQERVGELTGLRATEVNVEVEQLATTQPPQARVR